MARIGKSGKLQNKQNSEKKCKNMRQTALPKLWHSLARKEEAKNCKNLQFPACTTRRVPVSSSDFRRCQDVHKFPVHDREDKNGVFGERGFCPLLKTSGFDENGEKYEWALCPQKQGLCSSDPENDGNGRCHGRMKDPAC